MSSSGHGNSPLGFVNHFLHYPRCPQGWGRPMMTILIGAGASGFVLGATSRIVFLLPAVLMALVVAGVLIVRADIDLGFTALAASLSMAVFARRRDRTGDVTFVGLAALGG